MLSKALALGLLSTSTFAQDEFVGKGNISHSGMNMSDRINCDANPRFFDEPHEEQRPGVEIKKREDGYYEIEMIHRADGHCGIGTLVYGYPNCNPKGTAIGYEQPNNSKATVWEIIKHESGGVIFKTRFPTTCNQTTMTFFKENWGSVPRMMPYTGGPDQGGAWRSTAAAPGRSKSSPRQHGHGYPAGPRRHRPYRMPVPGMRRQPCAGP